MRRVVPTDLEQINVWLASRKLQPIQADMLPKLGVIEPGVAAGFLVATDTPVGILDHFVSNPEASRLSVSKAIDQAVMCLCIAAKNRKMKRVLVVSKRRSILRRAAKWGFGWRGGDWGMMALEA